MFPLDLTKGFPGGADNKEYACKAGDPGLIPRLGRSPGEGNGNPLRYSCLENPMDRGAWQATIHGVADSQPHLGNYHFQPLCLNGDKLSLPGLEKALLVELDSDTIFFPWKKGKCCWSNWGKSQCVMYSFLSAYTELIVCSLGFSIIGIGFSYMERMMETKWWHPACLSLQGTDFMCFPFIQPLSSSVFVPPGFCLVFKKYSLSLTIGYTLQNFRLAHFIWLCLYLQPSLCMWQVSQLLNPGVSLFSCHKP